MHNNVSGQQRLTRAQKIELAREAAHAAMQVRFKTGMGIEEPVCVYALCERLGVPVRFVDFNLEGIYRPGPPKILLSAFRPLGRRNFNCAHELGHWYFGHGATLDELTNALEAYNDETPEEVLANSFAGHLLMPALGIGRAFARRQVRARDASPEQILAVASEFGVGYSALSTHLWLSLEEISYERAEELTRGRKVLKRFIDIHNLKGPIALVDEEFSAPTLDVEVGHTIIAPAGAISECGTLTPGKALALGTTFKVTKEGRAELHLPRTDWSASIRISRENFEGMAKYRHLEDDE